MPTPSKSLKQHDYNKKMRSLVSKGAALKKKSQVLNAQMASTKQQCDELLHLHKKQD